MLLTLTQIKPKSFESRRNSFFSFFFFTRDGCASCLRACFGATLLPQSHQYPNLSEGADRVGGQQRGDKECPFSGVTRSGRVWRKVPESDARSVHRKLTMERKRLLPFLPGFEPSTFRSQVRRATSVLSPFPRPSFGETAVASQAVKSCNYESSVV